MDGKRQRKRNCDNSENEQILLGVHLDLLLFCFFDSLRVALLLQSFAGTVNLRQKIGAILHRCSQLFFAQRQIDACNVLQVYGQVRLRLQMVLEILVG